jgi:hypothetical protein
MQWFMRLRRKREKPATRTRQLARRKLLKESPRDTDCRARSAIFNYPADLDACPTCKHKERVSPVIPKLPVRAAQSKTNPIPEKSVIEQEREEFLRQFKSQLAEAHAAGPNAPEAVCKFGEHHSGEAATAEICQACYERLQERLDVFEAALQLELKEAAQIIYDAVWADPSDPTKTYENAAGALLNELRKRAGMTAVLGPFSRCRTEDRC